MSRNVRKIALFVAVNLISVICLIWAFRGNDFHQLFREIQHLRWRWVAVAVVTNVLSYVVQGWRWSLVLAPVDWVPVRESTRAIYVGLYANEVLPLRSGEIIRCYLQSRCSDLPISVTLASALIERIMDGIWLMAALFFVVNEVRLPHFVRDAALFLGGLILICAVLLGIAMYWREQTLDTLLNARWFGWVHVLIKDLHLIGHSRYLYLAFLVSLAFLLIQVFPFYAALQAQHALQHLPFMASLVIALMLRLSSAIPQAPGNIGMFNWAATQALVIFGVGNAMAKRFSFILLGLFTLPVLIVGFVALALTGLGIGQLHRHAHKSMQQRDATPAPADPALKP